jgi:DNA repair protein RadC
MRIREVCVRYLPSPVPLYDTKPYRNSKEIFDAFRDLIQEPVEVFKAVILDSKNRPLNIDPVSRGSLSTSVVHPREALWSAVYHHAAAVIFVHNHPSGDPAPSREDRECTKRLFEAGKLLGIKVLDHVIIGEQDYYSFADAGLLSEGGCNG